MKHNPETAATPAATPTSAAVRADAVPPTGMETVHSALQQAPVQIGEAMSPLPQRPEAALAGGSAAPGAPGSCPERLAGFPAGINRRGGPRRNLAGLPAGINRRGGPRRNHSGREAGTPNREAGTPDREAGTPDREADSPRCPAADAANLALATFGTSVTRPEAIETIPLAKLMIRIQQGEWRKPVAALRKEQNAILRKEMKQRLPYFVCALFDGRRESGKLIQANGIVLDLDHLSDDEIAAYKETIPLGLHCARWLFRSPVDGLKVVIPFARPITGAEEYQRVFNWLRREMHYQFGVVPDNTPDMARACFVSWDEEFVAVSGAVALDPDEVKESGTDERMNGLNEAADVPALSVPVLAEAPFGQSSSGSTEAALPPAEAASGRCGDADVATPFVPALAAASNSAADRRPPATGAADLSTLKPLNPSTPTEAAVQSAVAHLCQCRIDWHDWSRCGIALYNHFGDHGRRYWMQFADNPHYADTASELAKHWNRFGKYPGVGIGTLFWIAEQHGWINAIGGGMGGTAEQMNRLKEAADVPALAEAPLGQSSSGSTEAALPPAEAASGRCGDADVATPSAADRRPPATGAANLSTLKPLNPSTLTQPTNSCNSCNSWTPSLKDFPELLELFGRPANVPLDRAQLPDAINRYLDTVGRITDAQDGAKLTAFLPVAAANIGNRVYMYNAGTRHYCNVWAAIIGPSTVSRKTTVINQAMKMLQPFKDTLRELTPKERNEQDLELCRVTQARLYNLLGINPNRLLLHMELSAWMQEMNKAYNAGMKQEITDMFDGKDRNIAKMEIDEYISRPAFSIIGATTEDWFYRELREVADQRGGFLQRFVICIIQNIDVDTLRLEATDDPDCDRELHAWDEPLGVFRSLPDSHRLNASDEALELRNGIYAELMKRIALNANDPQAAYCARIFDNYFWRFCILIHLLKHWQDLRDARDSLRLQSWFHANKVDAQTAREAWYLCEYYFANTQPFLKSLSDQFKLEEEKKLIRILQRAEGQKLPHARLLCKSRLTSREFRACMESLIERQAVICHNDKIYNNRTAIRYSLNPVLNEIQID